MSDSSRQTTIGNTEFFKPNWVDSVDTTRFIERELATGTVLNFPCGESSIGDVRADIDPSVNPDVVADLESVPFDDDSFDTVYCDPPYSMHAFDRNQWALNLWDVARKRLILQTTTQVYRFPNATREVWFADKRGTMVMQVIQVFDRESSSLSTFQSCEFDDGGGENDE